MCGSGWDVHGDFEIRDSDSVSLKIREELARRRLSRQWLADEAKISVSTLEKALAGRRAFTLSTVIRLEEALHLQLRTPAPELGGADPNRSTAPESMGAYSRPAVKWLEGDYLTIRRSFSDPEAFYAYRTVIEWDDRLCHLTFKEAARLDSAFAQAGFVSFPNISAHIYLVTVEQGQYRMAVLGRPVNGGELNGILTTLMVGSGSQLFPAATPLVLCPSRIASDDALGLIRPGHEQYNHYRDRIERVGTGGFARLLV
jgi:transcriptional regulator with XRE-family HTH domain